MSYVSPFVRNCLDAQAASGHRSVEQADFTLGDRCYADRRFTPPGVDRTIPSVVDGPINPEDMCPGSEGRHTTFSGNTILCSICLRWLPAYPGSFLAPVHASNASNEG